MNKVEAFFLEHIAPYGIFGTTSFYPKNGAEVTAETVATYKKGRGVKYIPETNSIQVPEGATVILKVDGEQIIVKDYRERPRHDPGASIELPGEEDFHTLNPDTNFVDLVVGLFRYYNSNNSKRK